MNRETIYANLRTIWDLFEQGDPVESQLGNLIFICLQVLKKHWFNTEFEIARPQHLEVDPIEIFLSNIANL